MATEQEKNSTTMIIVIAVLAVLAFLAYNFLNAPDRRTTGERVGDAVDHVQEGHGIDSAVKSMQDRTPAQKAGDAIENAGDDVQKAVDKK